MPPVAKAPKVPPLLQIGCVILPILRVILLTDTDVQWLTRAGRPFTEPDWHDPACDFLEMRLGTVGIRFDRQARSVTLYDEEA